MATGLIGDRAGSPSREPGRPQRSGSAQPRRAGPGPGDPQRPRPSGRAGSAGRSKLAERPAGGRAAAPVARRPATQRPATQRPATQRPATQRPATQRPATERASGQPRTQSAAQHRARTPFVLLIIGLLGGGLVCLLLINTTLAQGSFQINAMQQQNATLTQQEQALQQQTAQQESPASIAARAQQLGMRPVGRLRFIDLKTGRSYSEPATAPGVPVVPGYTP
jgi:hypothetical protein